jgi:hypothetical protein
MENIYSTLGEMVCLLLNLLNYSFIVEHSK